MNLNTSKDFLSHLPEYCQKYVPDALSGDPEAAESLMGLAPNELRGDIVRAFFELRIPPDVFREALTDAWDHDHVPLWHGLGSNRQRFNRAFRYADFPKDHLPSRFTIYRGGYGDLMEQGFGFSWTRNRDCACWFAMRTKKPTKPPIVLKREVLRRSVLAHINTRDEDEIVVGGVAHTLVDGDPADWLQGYEREVKRREQKEQAA